MPKLENLYEEYKECEFKIQIVKKPGKENADQMYYGSKEELAVGIASMFEQLMEQNVFEANELKYLLNLAIDKKEGRIQ